MLCANSYTRKYVDDCRAKITGHMRAFKTLAAATGSKAAIAAFEPHHFNTLLLAMDGYFIHRARGLEKKDGNALNEVRMLCGSIMHNRNKLGADKTIKYDAGRSVLKYESGDEIKLSDADFVRLSAAFFAEIESKFL